MAVKAAEQITITDMTDVKSFCRYYLLQSSTLAAPSKPTTNPPSSSWTKTEPSYTAGSTNSLYFTDLTVFSNDTFSYSDVSLSSSYEAAKTAYNKAVEAAKTATNFIDFTTANGLQVGNKQSGSWVGHRAQLKSGVFQIVSETGSRIAQFAATLIELGRNQADAVIQLCGGKGKISTDTNGIKIGDGWVNIESNGGIYSIIEEEVSGGLVKPGTITYNDIGKIGLTAKNRRGTGQVKFTAFASGGSNLGGDPDTATIEASLTTDDVTNTSTLKVSPTSINLQSDMVNIEAESVNICGNGAIRYNSETDMIEIFYNGVWKEWVFAGIQTCYLYNRGNEIDLLTGGWISDGYTMSTDKTHSGVLNEASMSINGPGSNGNSQILGTYNPIDITNYTKIKIHVLNAKLYNTLGGYLILATTKQLNTDICIEINSTSENTYILDITDLSGEYYIACVARGTATRGFVADKIWLE